MLIDPLVMYFFSGVGLYVSCCVVVFLVPQAIYWLKHKNFRPSLSDLKSSHAQEISEYKQTIAVLETERDLETKRADQAAILLEETVSKLTNMLN